MDSIRLEDQLIDHEGIRLHPYTDTVGKLTIGIGRNLTDNGISLDEAKALLKSDILNTISFLNFRASWWKDLDEVRARAIADMAFNLMNKLLGFKQMIQALVDKNWELAAQELEGSLFYKQVGIRGRHLAHMIRTGTDY